MPSNRELKAAAATLGEKLGVAVKTDGLGNADLVKLVAELEEQAAATAAVEASASPPAAPARSRTWASTWGTGSSSTARRRG